MLVNSYLEEYTVESIGIDMFRGIKKGEIKGFKKLNIIVGRNGTGKSSLLEALYLVTAPVRDIVNIFTIYRLCTRHGWIGLPSIYGLFYKGFGDAGKAFEGFDIYVGFTNGAGEIVKVERDYVYDNDVNVFSKHGLDISKVICLSVNASGAYDQAYRICVDDKGKYIVLGLQEAREKPFPSIFIDWGLTEEYGKPEKLYSFLIARYGMVFKKALLDIIKSFTGIEDIELLEEDGKTVLYAVFSDYSIPIYYLSDGIKYTIINLMFLGVVKNGIIIIEEPEVHQHRRLLEILVEAIIKSVLKYGNQVFISTHSLELIDILVEYAKYYNVEEDTIGFYRLKLDNGILQAVTYDYDTVERLRRDLEYDFRG